MPPNKRSQTEQFEKILDFLGNQIRSAPGDELLEAAREEGRDPGEENTRLKDLLTKKLKSHQQKKLAEAREGYERELASIAEGDCNLPDTPEERRALFMATLSHATHLQSAFTMQHRSLSEFSDEDILANLKKFYQLGLLPKSRARDRA